jgi:hypothetical protein
MIVREVLKQPELLDCFDWFNDSGDTIRFLKGVGTKESLALAEKMEQKAAEYFAGLRKRLMS